jgi:hypothetical protein
MKDRRWRPPHLVAKRVLLAMTLVVGALSASSIRMA